MLSSLITILCFPQCQRNKTFWKAMPRLAENRKLTAERHRAIRVWFARHVWSDTVKRKTNLDFIWQPGRHSKRLANVKRLYFILKLETCIPIEFYLWWEEHSISLNILFQLHYFFFWYKKPPKTILMEFKNLLMPQTKLQYNIFINFHQISYSCVCKTVCVDYVSEINKLKTPCQMTTNLKAC